MVGIISSIGASAIYNLNYNVLQSQLSIYRLSSGNAIATSGDNPAGLAMGSALAANVSTYKAALTNATQAQNMLGVADGALSNIASLLKTQLSLATQSASGSLTNAARVALNQEFQSLTSQVNLIATTTSFNGINLIDGSLYSPNTIKTNTSSNATYATGQLTQIATVAAGSTLVITDDDGNSVTFTYDTAANVATAIGANTDRQVLYIATDTNNTIATQMNALYNNISGILSYAGIDTTVMNAKQILSKMHFTSDSATYLNATSLAAGSIGNSMTVNTSVAATWKLNNVALTTGAKAFTTNGTASIDGDLNAGTFGTTTAFSGTATTIATGSVGDSILAAINTTTQSSTGVDASLISNNASFTGTIQGFTATYGAANVVTAQITVGGIQYTANSINTNTVSGQKVTFSSANGTGGSFTLKFGANMTAANQTDANTFATRLNSAFSTVVFEQNRKINNYTASGTIYGVPSGAATGDLASSTFNLINSNFNNIQAQSVTVTAPPAGGTIATIQIQIGNEIYQTGYLKTGAVTVSGLDGTNPSGTVITAGDTIGLVSTTNSNHVLQFYYAGGSGGATNLDISTTANAQAAQLALQKAFGINTGATSATFQVGLTPADSIPVQIPSATPTAIYLDNSGNSQSSTMAIDTLTDATNAITYLNNAVNSIALTQAMVGGSEDRFNAASNILNSTIYNTDNARGLYLDTDIASESTNFAQAQVRVQVGLAVIAQANHMSQELLKLLAHS